MIIGAHFLIYSSDADADRAFFKDVLGFRAVDAGHGWLIFGMPPAEAAFHPADDDSAESHGEPGVLGGNLYLMCDDLHAEVKSLEAKNVHCTSITQAGWGLKTTIPLPSGGHIGLYQPRHPTALNLEP
jgi:catechol 2,3-dioxygenase-like lactoylglutathione lyase family enzyme